MSTDDIGDICPFGTEPKPQKGLLTFYEQQWFDSNGKDIDIM